MLNYNLLKDVQAGFNKSAFVQMPGKSAQDMGTNAVPMDAAAQMDPNAMAAMDPNAMAGGGMPPDAAAMPPPGLDPAMAGMVGAPPPADPAAAGMGGATITCTLDDLAKFMQKVLAIKNSGGIEQPQNNDMAEIRQALTQIAAQMGQGAQIA